MNILINSFYRIIENPEYLILLVTVFLAVSLAIGAGFFLIMQKSFFKGRLARFVPGEQAPRAVNDSVLVARGEGGVMQKVSEPIYKAVLPGREEKRKKGRLKLIQAGFRSRNAYRDYLLLKVLCACIFSLGLLFTVFFYRLSPEALSGAAALALAGFFTPSLALKFITMQRQLEITRALPDALDLMVVCAEAGLGLDMTFKRVGEEIRPLSKALSDEYRLTMMEIRAGRPRSDSFRYLAERTGVQEVNNLMTILVQASRFGTSVGKALRVHADAMRVKRRQIAEEKAAKVAVKLIFPLMLFIFPALMIVIGGPAFISIWRVLFPALEGVG
ncbi:MAG TPA: type II secretion system F family protein [Geothermobacteraceae bacterium]|nr:type II secretion system F family protein [Geothermobacteraceae bacterium]